MYLKVLNVLKKLWGLQSSGWKSLLVAFIICLILIIIPTGFEDAVIYQGTDKVKAEVVEVDNSAIKDAGLIRTGEQICKVYLKAGKFKGQTREAINLLTGSLAQDKEFKVGDLAMVVVSNDGENVSSITMIDHFRIGWEIVLLVIFALLLILFSGPVGIRALFSFIISVLSIWKILIPACLKGINPILVGLFLVTFLTIVIISFVYGVDKKSLAAIMGSMLGVIVACLLSIFFTHVLKIHGAIMTDSESLLYSGYQNLNLTNIFMAGIFIGASGAMMDLSVDITSGIAEVIRKKPDITRWEAMASGIRIGQAATGTMTTTLLLAYAGSCTSQLMVFMAQGTPIVNILNYKYVASEILQTLVGSFALVTVAPFTAVVAGILLVKRDR
ncbi:YibE/F family protein [Lachnospira pectinoschiza]|uniref:Uncharacterized membrane protein n=1 Tax=Lachnospira pectinoschiza TaxID=28052 RepID=A0A1G9YSZ7_9FIRM|nr:YibE/F family protein [Lachnospira pectinoschiza]SDN12234.1 Uncharacterized membrane protein [Lachnospira pectinoschiza]